VATPILRAGPRARISAQFRSLDRTLDDQDAEANISQAENPVINVAKLALLGGTGSANSGTCRVHRGGCDSWLWLGIEPRARRLPVCLSCATSAVLTRMGVVLDQGSFTALQADNRGGQVIFAGILLLVPGFINDIVALILLIAPSPRWALSALEAASRLPAMVAWSISRPNNGIRYPIPYYPTGAKTNYPTGAKTNAIVKPHTILNSAGRFRKRSCRRKTIPSLFPS
jgi:FxsA cytoplasmic membrane protein